MKIVADAHIPYIKNYFSPCGELILKPGRDMTNADVKDADILIVRSVVKVDEKLLANSRVKFVGTVTAGADHLDTDYLDSAGILYTTAHGFNSPPVADYVVSVLAALDDHNKISVKKRQRAAVIGVGKVGSLVVERLRALNFDVILCDPVRAQSDDQFHSTLIDDIADMDLITLHTPLTHTGSHPTFHLIDKTFLQRQKPGCVLINASRGAVINSEDLKKHGTHLSWCLDVFENEPWIDREILKSAFIATPHLAGYSVQSKIRGTAMIYRIACEKGVIKPHAVMQREMPNQQLTFADRPQRWQNIVLGVFNPLLMTSMMRATLMNTEEYGIYFDEMRHQFNYRHEFAFTEIVDTKIGDTDKALLEKFGMTIQP